MAVVVGLMLGVTNSERVEARRYPRRQICNVALNLEG